ncbi:hypothetical protein BGZ94_003685, partial [Podila epigama]
QMQIIHDIACGLEFLHQCGIQHLNLHSANVLIGMHGIAILTDFGRPNNRAEVGQPPKPTVELERIRSLATVFMAPEVLVSGSYSTLSEVYALGMVMFELLTGRVAFEKDLGIPGLSTKIMFGRQETIPSNIHSSPGPVYEALIAQCWKLKPQDRPHLSELKHRLEQLMAECRHRNELLRQEQDRLSKQQPQHQQAQQQIEQTSTTSTTATATAAASSLSTAAASSTTSTLTPPTNPPAQFVPNFVTTTHIIITESVKSLPFSSPAESLSQDGLASTATSGSALSNKAPSNNTAASATKKPVEAWYIGHAQAPVIAQQQRDALPITSRALEITAGHRKNKSMSGSELLFTQPLTSASTATSFSISTGTNSHGYGNGLLPNPSTQTTTTTATTPTTTTSTASHASAKTASDVATDQGSTPKGNIPSSPTPSGLPSTGSGTSSTSVTTMPPPQQAKAAAASTSHAHVPAPAPVPTSSQSPTRASHSSQPIRIPARTTSTTPGLMTSLEHPSPKTALTPASNASPNSQSTKADSMDRPQQQQLSPTHFNWRHMPRIPDDAPEMQQLQRVAGATPVIVEENGYDPVNEAHLTSEPESLSNGRLSEAKQQRRNKYKSQVATMEQAHPVQPQSALERQVQPLPQPTQLQYQASPTPQSSQYDHSHHQNGNAAADKTPTASQPPATMTATNGRMPRESILVIPAFPEPPSTLHNRRISNIDVRYRSAGHQQTFPRFQEERRGNSFSSDDSNPRSLNRGIPASMPQEAMNGAPATGGFTTRGAYTPITSSEDVPAPTQSVDIFSAAKNGDLEELQYYLNAALSRSISDDSSGNGNGGNQGPRRSKASAIDILDEYEPIERLPVLCCAAVARKNKYKALNMVLRAGANVEGKEQRGGNTPLHLVCETADPPLSQLAPVRLRQDQHGNRIRVENVVGLLEDPNMRRLSLLDLSPAHVETRDDEDTINGDETEEGQEAALRRADEMEEQEQRAMDRVKEDAESVFSVNVHENDQGLFGRPIGNSSSYYQIQDQILLKGGLEDQIRLLALAGSPLDIANSRGETPMLLLLRYHDCVTALATLLRLGADPTIMAPFGPGLNPTEVQLDPKTVLTPSAQKKMGKKFFLSSSSSSSSLLSKQNPLLIQQHMQQASGEDPNHILVMHGCALAHAAYYLREDCVKYLLENEIECSAPALVEQAIIACQHSVAAKVNPSLVSVQGKIVSLLERKWRGEEGRRRRCRVADRVLNKQGKPIRSNALLEALAVSADADSASASASASNQDNNNVGGLAKEMEPSLRVSTSTRPGIVNGNGKISSSLGAIPTTHLYATDGPSGQSIELISHHGFKGDPGPVSPTSPRFPGSNFGAHMNGMHHTLQPHEELNHGETQDKGLF